MIEEYSPLLCRLQIRSSEKNLRINWIPPIAARPPISRRRRSAIKASSRLTKPAGRLYRVTGVCPAIIVGSINLLLEKDRIRAWEADGFLAPYKSYLLNGYQAHCFAGGDPLQHPRPNPCSAAVSVRATLAYPPGTLLSHQ